MTLITPHEAAQVESGALRWQESRAAYAGPNTSWATLRFLQDGSPPPERTRTYYTFTPDDPTPRVVEVGRTAAGPDCEPLTRAERWQIAVPTAVGLVLWLVLGGYLAVQVWRWLS